MRLNEVTACEDGSATVLGVAVAAVIAAIALSIAALSLGAVAAVKAQTAADSGALAGAHVLWLRGAETVCDAARSAVQANDATLVTCAITGTHVRVVAGVRGITREALAGPASEPPTPS